ncbi:MAG: tripartite tricarboxylate transporter substrate-binding protein, partial [Atribacterota bacterium]|nr:tripartite tricarboxylate transporter substrate-binding protein [Atribacterota bacterium]
ASELVQFVESNQMRILGSMSEERYPDYPDVPTFLELGYDLLASSSRGISAPPGTPDDVLEILGEAFEKAVNDPEFLEQAKIAGLALNVKLLDDYRVMRDNMWEDYEELYSKRPWGGE